MLRVPLRALPRRGLHLSIQLHCPRRRFHNRKCCCFLGGGRGDGGMALAAENERRIYRDVNVVRLRRRQGLSFRVSRKSLSSIVLSGGVLRLHSRRCRVTLLGQREVLR